MSLSNVLPTCNLLWTLPLFKHILAHFSKPKFIFISLLIACTIFISFFNSFSFLPSSFRSSIYNRWLIFLSVPCTWYPQSALFNSFVNGISAMQKSNGERESPWNIPLCIWMGCDCITSCFVFKIIITIILSCICVMTHVILRFLCLFLYQPVSYHLM